MSSRIFEADFFIPVGPSMPFQVRERHELSRDRRADLLAEMRVGAANAFEHDPGRSEGAASKGAIIRR
jgi:hypothetical protein